MLLFRVLWSIFWRAVLVLIVNAGISYAIGMASHQLSDNTTELIKLRRSLAFLPAAIIFAGFAWKNRTLGNGLMQNRSPLDAKQWRETYLVLSALCVVLISISSAAAYALEIDSWLAVQQLTNPTLWLATWIGLSIWQTTKIRKSRL